MEEATRELEGREFDLVVMDCPLCTERDGLSLLEYLNGFLSRPPAILMSGSDLEAAARELGAFCRGSC